VALLRLQNGEVDIPGDGIPPAKFQEVMGDPEQAARVVQGGMAWIADFPDPANFYYPIRGCAGAAEGGWNWAKSCNQELDVQEAQADSISDPARAEERLQMRSDIYMKVMEDSPWAPVFNEERFTMKSPRMGGADNLYVDPVSIPVNYDYVYVTE
jgi:ABC-type transport system substrate-binding protein